MVRILVTYMSTLAIYPLMAGVVIDEGSVAGCVRIRIRVLSWPVAVRKHQPNTCTFTCGRLYLFFFSSYEYCKVTGTATPQPRCLFFLVLDSLRQTGFES